MSQPGVVPNIMEALEMKKMDVLYAVLKVINMVRTSEKATKTVMWLCMWSFADPLSTVLLP